MSDEQIPVGQAQENGWKATLAKPIVWIPAAAIVAILVVVWALAANAGEPQPATSPSATASASPSPSAVSTATPSPSVSPSLVPSATPTSTALPPEGPTLAYAFPGFAEGVTVASVDYGAFTDVQFSPDDRHVLGVQLGEEPVADRVVVVDATDPEPTEPLPGKGPAVAAWNPAKPHEAVIASSTASGLKVIALDAETGSQRALWTLDGADRPMQISVSTDGKFAALTLSPANDYTIASKSVVLVPLNAAAVTQLGAGASATFIPGTHAVLAWVPDGSHAQVAVLKAGATPRIVGKGAGHRDGHISGGGEFYFNPAGTLAVYFSEVDEYIYELRVIRADGSGDRSVRSVGDEGGFPQWSHDGKRVLLWTSETSHGEVLEIDIASGAETAVKATTMQDAGSIVSTSWLPDESGFTVGFSSKGDNRAWLWNQDGSSPYFYEGPNVVGLIASRQAPVWSSDGQLLAWATSSGKGYPAQLDIYNNANPLVSDGD